MYVSETHPIAEHSSALQSTNDTEFERERENNVVSQALAKRV